MPSINHIAGTEYDYIGISWVRAREAVAEREERGWVLDSWSAVALTEGETSDTEVVMCFRRFRSDGPKMIDASRLVEVLEAKRERAQDDLRETTDDVSRAKAHATMHAYEDAQYHLHKAMGHF